MRFRKHGTTQTSLSSEQKTFRTRRRIGVVVVLRSPYTATKFWGVFARTRWAGDWRASNVVVTLVYGITIDCAPRLVTHHANQPAQTVGVIPCFL